MMMTSLMTSQRDDKVSLLYSSLNEISAFSCIIHERFDKSSPNWINICTGSLVPASYLDNQVGHKTRSPGQKIGQILKLP